MTAPTCQTCDDTGEIALCRDPGRCSHTFDLSMPCPRGCGDPVEDDVERSWAPRHAAPAVLPVWLLLLGSLIAGVAMAGVVLVASHGVCAMHEGQAEPGPSYCQADRP